MQPTLIHYASIPAPIGPLWAAVSDRGLWALDYGLNEREFLAAVARRGRVAIGGDPARAADALAQVSEYLAGARRDFALEVDWRGMTPFQVEVRKAVMAVPFGQTATYGDIARKVCTHRAARAVGQANASNPILFVIPCHRIIGSDGRLTGFGGLGGVAMKARLLDMEAGWLRL